MLQREVSAGLVLLWFPYLYFSAAVIFLNALNSVRCNLISCCSPIFGAGGVLFGSDWGRKRRCPPSTFTKVLSLLLV